MFRFVWDFVIGGGGGGGRVGGGGGGGGREEEEVSLGVIITYTEIKFHILLFTLH